MMVSDRYHCPKLNLWLPLLSFKSTEKRVAPSKNWCCVDKGISLMWVCSPVVCLRSFVSLCCCVVWPSFMVLVMASHGFLQLSAGGGGMVRLWPKHVVKHQFINDHSLRNTS